MYLHDMTAVTTALSSVQALRRVLPAQEYCDSY